MHNTILVAFSSCKKFSVATQSNAAYKKIKRRSVSCDLVEKIPTLVVANTQEKSTAHTGKIIFVHISWIFLRYHISWIRMNLVTWKEDVPLVFSSFKVWFLQYAKSYLLINLFLKVISLTKSLCVKTNNLNMYLLKIVSNFL